MKKDNRSLSHVAAFICAVTFLLFTNSAQAEQEIQALHNHVRPEVAGGQALPVGVMPGTQRLNLAMQLPIRNEGELDNLLRRLYDPKSPDYRQFLSVAQFTERFGPTKEDYQAVVAFAKANGFTVSTTPNRMVVDIAGTVAQIDSAFHVVMTVYQHPTENRTFYSPDREPSLGLRVPVAHIAGLNNFFIPRPKLVKGPEDNPNSSRSGSGPGGQYLGSDMRAAYYGNGPLTGSGQTVGLFEFNGYAISDVTGTFDGAATATTSGGNYIVQYTTRGSVYNVQLNNVLLDGAGSGDNGGDGEQVLDIVQAISMAPGLDQVLVYIAPPGDSQAVDILNRMATDNIARQLSCSFGFDPDESTIHPIFAEMASQGQTFFTASGDNGAIGPSTGGALVWPADDSLQVAVGATDLVTDGPGGAWQSETAWSNSAGGPSDNGISLPWYQVGVANSSNQGSTTLRNLPDVAAEGNFDNYLCQDGSCGGGEGGTSYASPRWAGFMALVNQQATVVGKFGVGFINPALYALGESPIYNNDFHDITSGNNDCCGQTTFWSAVTGYDLVTGWGSPTGPELIYSLAGVEPPTIDSPNNVTFTVGTAGSFQVTAAGLPAAFTFSESGALPTGVTFNSSGLLSGTAAPGTGGVYPLTITVSNGVAPNGTQAFTLTIDQAPAITSANHTTFTAGTAGSFQVTATGYPAPTLAESGALPSGVSFSPSGLLSGTPAPGTGGVYTVTITASNGVVPNATQTFTLTVDQAPSITSANSAFFQVGHAGSFQVTATGFPPPTFTESGALPSGVTFSASGLLSGTPAAGTQGYYTITITAKNGVLPNATQSFTLTVALPPTITSANHVTFTIGLAGTFNVTATGFPPPTFTESGALPSGVTLNSSGLLSGIPAPGTAGVYPIIITASNGALPNATQSFTLTVVKATTTCSITSSSDIFSGDPIIFTAFVKTGAGQVDTPTGTVRFVDSDYYLQTLGTKPLYEGVSSLTYVLQPPPTRQFIKAVYSGDNSFKGCTSPYITENYK